MAKLTERELQLRAMREARFEPPKRQPTKPEAKPERVMVTSDPSDGVGRSLTDLQKAETKARFNRTAYQREYMRKWRKRKKK